jgi:transposase
MWNVKTQRRYGKIATFVDWASGRFQVSVGIVRRLQDQAGFVVLARRWVVGRTFAWPGKCRGLARDHEELAETTEAWIYLAMSSLYPRRSA